MRIGREAPARIPIGAHQVRCHLIDRIVVEKISRNPDLLVVLVGPVLTPAHSALPVVRNGYRVATLRFGASKQA